MDVRALADTLCGDPSPLSGALEDPCVGVDTAPSPLAQTLVCAMMAMVTWFVGLPRAQTCCIIWSIGNGFLQQEARERQRAIKALERLGSTVTVARAA